MNWYLLIDLKSFDFPPYKLKLTVFLITAVILSFKDFR